MSGQTMTILGEVDTAWREEFWTDLRERGLSPASVAAYMQDVRVFCEWFGRANGTAFEPRLMNSMDARNFRTWSLEVMRVSAATWNRRRSTLAVLCEWIEERGISLFNFKKTVKRKAQQEQAPRWLEMSEHRALMREMELRVNAANTPARKVRAKRDQALVGLLRFAGLRVGEVLALKVVDVELSERKGMVTVRAGKRDKSRSVPLSAQARALVGLWLEVRGTEDGLLFGELTARQVQKMLVELGRELGIDGLTPHALRHTCGKSIVDAGRPLTEAQAILGHTRLETTSRYVQPGRADLAAAVDAGELGGMMRRGG